NEGIVRVFVALRQLSAAGKRGAPAHRNVRVLTHEQRFKAALLERTRELGDVDAVVGWEVVRANLHAQISAGLRATLFCRQRYHVRLGADQAAQRRASTTAGARPGRPAIVARDQVAAGRELAQVARHAVGGCEYFEKRIADITDNRFQIEPFAAGEIVPGLQVLDPVQKGTVEIGNAAMYYYWGKDPAMTF